LVNTAAAIMIQNLARATDGRPEEKIMHWSPAFVRRTLDDRNCRRGRVNKKVLIINSL